MVINYELSLEMVHLELSSYLCRVLLLRFGRHLKSILTRPNVGFYWLY